MAVNYTATKELTPMAIVISIGFVELLNWISGLIASPRVVLNALVYNPLVDKGSQWTVFISIVVLTRLLCVVLGGCQYDLSIQTPGILSMNRSIRCQILGNI